MATRDDNFFSDKTIQPKEKRICTSGIYFLFIAVFAPLLLCNALFKCSHHVRPRQTKSSDSGNVTPLYIHGPSITGYPARNQTDDLF